MNNVSKLKVVVGYTLLLAVLFFSLYFVHREMANLTQSESQGTQWIDSLSVLLEEQEDNTYRILRTLTEVNDSLISATRVEHLITAHDTLVVRPQVQRRRVVHTDTVVTQPESKGFFRRLRDAFVPSKQDSSVQVKTSVEYAVDTVVQAYNPWDTLQARLRAVAERERRADTLIRRRKRRLQQVNTRLSARIDTLLRHYEEEMLQQARTDATYRHDLRMRSARIVGGIAVGAVLLAGLFLALIGRDIARSNRYRRELEEARRRAEDLLAMREKMMLAITHDFKAPLSSIIGYVDLMAARAPQGKEREYLENIRTSSAHLLKLVTDLLDFHRLEQHKADIDRVPFSPQELFREVCLSFRPLTEAKGLELAADVRPSLEGTFVCDPLRLRQIADNLLSNAVKFTDHGRITLSAEYTGDRLRLSVADTGRGMAPGDRERIFHEFTRLPGAQGAEGFGLGLSIVRMLVQLLGGTIDVDSRLGEGSTFTVSIPMSRAAESGTDGASCPPPELPAAAARPAPAPPSYRLLLIDDDRIQLSLTEAMLRQTGISSVACVQVDELLDALRTDRFDALLTDVQMPALNGFELLQLLRASNIARAQTIPVIAVTARSDMQRDAFVSHGFAGCLHKPFSVQELLDELERMERLDFSALTTFASDDPDEAQSILRTFADETRRNAGRLRQASDDGDARALSAVAHKMLPLFTLIGAARLLPLLRRLEASASAPWDENLKAVAAQALDEVESALKQLDTIVFQPSGQSVSEK